MTTASEVENKYDQQGILMLTFVLVHAVVTVLLPVTPPGQRDALTAVSTLPLVFPALCWWRHAVLHTNDETKHSPHPLVWQAKLQYALSQNSTQYRFTSPHSNCSSLPSRLTRLCSRPRHHRATLSASTRGCADIGAAPGSVGVLCNPPRQSGRRSQHIHHISGPQTHTDR